ncbi:hypothetical protein E2C01_099685 [Portunus trituberculatus]|uniref:Uncharacterized protein n=1 Tax=Portunus trituberculatus TaxID=210409 RepID=A0A5B7KBJ1_PORTR|nr:hypothetical protein [Portunus trituberculatus]
MHNRCSHRLVFVPPLCGVRRPSDTILTRQPHQSSLAGSCEARYLAAAGRRYPHAQEVPPGTLR